MSGSDASAPGRTIGTAGHIDHGKTELVRALTGVDTDRLPEERERGISIDLGFAPLDLGAGTPPASVVDVPGHEGFVRTMVAGATGIDAVLFVVAADEGMMPQSREHLLVLEALGVDRGVVAVAKADLVEREWLELVVESVREELAGSPLAGAPVVATSTRTGRGVEEVRRALADVVAGPAAAGREGFPFRLPVDRAFTLPGAGTVVTGTVASGTVAEGDEVAVFAAEGEPGERPVAARVRSLEVHGRGVSRAAAGRRAALALAGLAHERAGRGAVVVEPATPWRAVARVDAEVWLAPGAPRAVRRGARVRVLHGTREVMARAWWYGSGPVEPGGRGGARLSLEAPLVAAVGDRVVVRAYSPVTTIGGGTVLALDPPRTRGSARRERAERLAALAAATPAERARLAVVAAGGEGIAQEALPLATGLGPDALAGVRAAPGVEVHGGRWFDGAERERAAARVTEAVDRHHADAPLEPALPLAEARRAGAPAHPALVEAAIETAVAGGALERRGAGVARTGRTVELPAADRALAERIRATLDEAGLEAPDTPRLAGRLEVGEARLRPLLAHLERTGEVVRLAGDWHVDAGHLREAAAAVSKRIAADGAADVGALKEVLGVSRKYLIPVLEHLDRSGVTRREGDHRVLGGSR